MNKQFPLRPVAAVFLLAAAPAALAQGGSTSVQCDTHCRVQLPDLPSREGLRPRWVPPKPAQVSIAGANVAGMFVVKLVEGSHIRLGPKGFFEDRRLGAITSDLPNRLERTGLDSRLLGVRLLDRELASLNQLAVQYRKAYRFEPSYAFRPDLPRNGVDRQFLERDWLEQRSGGELADLDLYYVFHAPNFRDRAVQERFMNALNRLRLVEQVYPTVVAATPSADVNGRQNYLDPAPTGVDARFAWTVPGGRGRGVRLADVEYDWVTDHEDFPPASALAGGSRPACAYDGSQTEHGTAVMGVVAGRHDNSGIMGIAPDVQYVLSSVCRPFDYAWAGLVATFSGENWVGRANNVVVANAIQEAANHLRPGDVLLIEQHVPGPATGLPCPTNCPQFEYVPMEYYAESYDLIHRLAASGIIIVEAAGNGSVNLDGPVHRTWRGQLSAHSSGALLVGAAMASASGNVRADFSNSSARIDFHSWGGGVVTTGYRDDPGAGPPFNNPEIPRFYTPRFGGTSSASAIVAGAVASLQGARRATGLPALTPPQAREILYRTGIPAASGAIGRQPDLRAALRSATAAPGGFGGGGIYVIRSRHSGKVLDVDSSWFGGGFDGQNLIQWDYHGGDNQRFQIDPVGPGEFAIRTVHSGKCLEVESGAVDDGAPLKQYGCHLGPGQRFRIEPDGPSYRIVAAHSGRVLDVYGWSRDNGGRIVQFANYRGANQLFEFVRDR